MTDPSKNPNADPAKRRKLMSALADDLYTVLLKHAEPIGAVAEDVPIFWRSIMASYVLAVMPILGMSEPEITLAEHLRLQFSSSKAAFAMLARANEDEMDKPMSAVLEKRK